MHIETDRARKKDVAYRFLSFGMRHGRLTGQRLDTELTATQADDVNACRIINGADQAGRIAGYAREMETILLASLPVPEAVEQG